MYQAKPHEGVNNEAIKKICSSVPTLYKINCLVMALSFKSLLQLHEQPLGILTCQKHFPFSKYSFTQVTKKDPILAKKFQMCLNMEGLFQSSNLLIPKPPLLIWKTNQVPIYLSSSLCSIKTTIEKLVKFFFSKRWIIFLARMKMDDKYTLTLYKIEESNCSRPAKERFFAMHDLIRADTFSSKISQSSIEFPRNKLDSKVPHKERSFYHMQAIKKYLLCCRR